MSGDGVGLNVWAVFYDGKAGSMSSLDMLVVIVVLRAYQSGHTKIAHELSEDEIGN